MSGFFFGGRGGKLWQYICVGNSPSSHKKAFEIKKFENQNEYAESYIILTLIPQSSQGSEWFWFFRNFWQNIFVGNSPSSQKKKAFEIKKVENRKEYAENYIY